MAKRRSPLTPLPPVKKKVYYAHCQNLYGTPQEKRDVETLQALDFDVVNPGDPKHKESLDVYLKHLRKGATVMDYFYELVNGCEVFAFRSLPDGSIPAGVMGEMMHAREIDLPVIELPSMALRRVLQVEETRDYLKETGQR